VTNKAFTNQFISQRLEGTGIIQVQYAEQEDVILQAGYASSNALNALGGLAEVWNCAANVQTMGQFQGLGFALGGAQSTACDPPARNGSTVSAQSGLAFTYADGVVTTRSRRAVKARVLGASMTVLNLFERSFGSGAAAVSGALHELEQAPKVSAPHSLYFHWNDGGTTVGADRPAEEPPLLPVPGPSSGGPSVSPASSAGSGVAATTAAPSMAPPNGWQTTSSPAVRRPVFYDSLLESPG
jgi:hypothetical protein